MKRTALSYTLLEVDSGVRQALEDFRASDLQLLELSAHEQAVTHRIANYLQKYFPDWHVDCEYNRNTKVLKTLNGDELRPDILIHRRLSNTPIDNLLCIEAKKINKPLDDAKKKLRGLTKLNGEYEYRFGLLMILCLDSPFSIMGEWYHDGNISESFVFPVG